MRISDWSSDVCSSDLPYLRELRQHAVNAVLGLVDILQEKDRAIEIGQIRRSDQRGENRQIATKEPAHRLARPKRPRAPTLLHKAVIGGIRVAVDRCFPFKSKAPERIPGQFSPCARSIGAITGDKTGPGGKTG